MSSDRSKQSAFVAKTCLAHGDELQRYLTGKVRNAQDVHELTQEVWARLLRVRKPERILKPLAYVYAIAGHVLAEWRIRGQKGPVLFDSALVEQTAERRDLARDMAEHLGDQEELERVLASIPRTYRRVMLMKLTGGLSYAEIGEQLDLSPKTVEQYYFRGLALARTLRRR
jgi:RNA polymerase sigma-70 factor (ECF subfamily)